MKTKEDILDEIYEAYGSDSGVLLGIKEKDVVRAIVEFTLNRIELPTSNAEEERLKDIIEKLVKDDSMYHVHVQESYKEQRWKLFKREHKL